MTEQQTVTAALLVIGNEILSGRTQDANLAHVAKALNEVGVQLVEARVVKDVEADIVAALDALRARYDHVITTGGIGPTHDDITARSVAKAFGRELARNPEAHRRLVAHYAQFDGLELNAARLRMADTPAGAELIDNPISAAPGFRVENVHVLAGVPSIMQAMLDGFRHDLRGGAPVRSRSVACNLGEGTVAAELTRLQARWPEVEIGSYPRFAGSGYRTAVVLRDSDEQRLGRVFDELCALIRELGGQPRPEEPA